MILTSSRSLAECGEDFSDPVVDLLPDRDGVTLAHWLVEQAIGQRGGFDPAISTENWLPPQSALEWFATAG